MRYLVAVLLITGCSGRPSPGDACAGPEYACGSVLNNDRLMLRCAGGAYESIGTCQTQPCAEDGAADSLACDGVRYTARVSNCTGEHEWACKANGGELLACRQGRWIPEWRCGGETDSCVPNGDGAFKLPDAGVPEIRCSTF